MKIVLSVKELVWLESQGNTRTLTVNEIRQQIGLPILETDSCSGTGSCSTTCGNITYTVTGFSTERCRCRTSGGSIYIDCQPPCASYEIQCQGQ